MGEILESDIETNFGHFASTAVDQFSGGFQPTADQPFLRGQVADFGEVAFEGGQLTTRIAGNLFQSQIVHVVFVQIVEDVDFPGLHEIEQ